MIWPYAIGIVMQCAILAVWLRLYLARPQFRACALLAIAQVLPIIQSIVKTLNAYYNAQVGIEHPAWILSFFRITPHFALLNWLLFFGGLVWLTQTIKRETPRQGNCQP